jgi:adenylate cyclase
MSEGTFEPFRKIFEAPLQADDVGRIADALGGVEHTKLAGEAADLLHRFSVLLEITRTVSASMSLDELLPRLIDVITDVLRADRATLFLYDKETDELFSRLMQGDAVSEIRIPSSAGIAGMVFFTGESLNIPDAYADDRFNPEVDKRTNYRTRNIVCVPLINKDGEVIGVTQLLNKEGGAFTEEDALLLRAMMAQAAAALEHAQLFENLEKARQDEATLLEVTNAVASDLDLDSLLAKIMTATTRLLDAERSTLFIHDRSTDELWSRVAEGMTSREIRFPSSFGIAGEAFSTGETLNIPDAYADPRFNPEVDRKTDFTTRNILCLPMKDKSGDIVAVMQVLNKIGGPFTERDEVRLRTFSSQAAIALENAALFQDIVQLRNYNEGILKSLSNGVVTMDTNLVITKVNDAAMRIVGMTEDALVGANVRETFAEPNDWVVGSLDFVVQTGGNDYHADTDFFNAGGQSISVNVTVAPLVDIDAKPIGFMLVFEDITGEKRLRSTMARYLAKEIVDKVLESGDDPFVGTAQEVTVMFSDIRRFTSMTEGLGAGGTVDMLNEYFTEMVDVVLRYNGLLDKYIGDAIMAVFGAPLTGPDDANNAVNAAVEMMQTLRGFNQKRIAAEQEPLDIGIGIATGDVIAGSVGSIKRMDYTVIGDAVNLAARLESANKFYGTSVLLSEATVAQLSSAEGLREIDLLRVKGRNEPIAVFEPIAYRPRSQRKPLEDSLPIFAEARSLYRKRKWREAEEGFEAFLARCEDDPAARLYVDRCRYYSDNEPDGDWDGVWTLTQK